VTVVKLLVNGQGHKITLNKVKGQDELNVQNPQSKTILHIYGIIRNSQTVKDVQQSVSASILLRLKQLLFHSCW